MCFIESCFLDPEKEDDPEKEGSGGGGGGGGGGSAPPGAPGGPPINRSTKPNTVSGGTDFEDLHGQQSMGYRVRDINEISMASIQQNLKLFDKCRGIASRGKVNFGDNF